MSSEYQPKFNRMSLNVLMLASAALIVIFGQSARQMNHKPLPPAPKLDISIWHADSGAKIWYSPYFSETLEIQLWYQAGRSFDDTQPRRAELLAKLLKLESQNLNLPLQVAIDQDFLKLTLHLSTDPIQMKQQIEKSVALIYRPKLSTKHLRTLQTIKDIPSLSDELWQKAYAGESYGHSPETPLDVQITRAQLQKYQQKYIHPERLHASIVGDISERGAQIIMESLLPASKHKAAHYSQQLSTPINNIEHRELFIATWPGESLETTQDDSPETKLNQQKAQLKSLINKQMIAQLLKSIHGDLVTLQTGKINSTLLIQQSSQLKRAVHDQIDSDMIDHQTRQLAKKWLAQVNNASGLSQYLVQLNAYQLPVNQLTKNLLALDGWDEDDWETASETLLPWLYKD